MLAEATEPVSVVILVYSTHLSNDFYSNLILWIIVLVYYYVYSIFLFYFVIVPVSKYGFLSGV